MGKVIITPANPLDIRAEDLQPLFEILETEGFEVSTEPGVEQRGYGVTWWEVTNAVLDHIDEVAVLVTAIKQWHESRRVTNRGRPQITTIYGPNGEVLQEVKTEPPTKEKKPTRRRRRKGK